MMKKIIALLLLIVVLACEKDKTEPIKNKYSERQVFNALVGTWKPNRLAYDVNFNKIQPVKENDSWFEHRVTFNADSVMTSKFDSETTDEIGKFTVEIGGVNRADTAKMIWFEGKISFRATVTVGQGMGVNLDHFTDSTLVFSKVGSDGNMFSEFKRVKQ